MWPSIHPSENTRRLLELLGEGLIAVAGGQRIRLPLPNLKCREIDFAYGGVDLRVKVTVENVGWARSGECDVIAHVWLSATGVTDVLQARCPALDAQSYVEVDLGVVASVATGQFVNVTVIVDPPTAARPGGEVWESNEEDNVCQNGIYTTPLAPRDPPSENPGKPKNPPEPPIRGGNQR